MKAKDVFLNEGVVIHDAPHLFAYAITVAEVYDAAPISEPQFSQSWKVLTKHNAEVMFRQIRGSGIHVEFDENDPYDAQAGGDPTVAIRFMLWDMVVNKTLKIFTGFSNTHPAFSPMENVIFRTVHDYYTHGKLRSAFKDQIEQMGLDKHVPTPEQLRRILPNIRLDQGGNVGHKFGLRGELNAYVTHAKLAPNGAIPALFTEIVGQICYNVAAGDFPTQKASVLTGFDYQNVGIALGERAVRMDAIVEQLKGGAQEIESSIRAAPVVSVPSMKARS